MITASPTEFAAATHGKLAGLDVGTKTIGLATCDAMWSFAGPAETIRRTKFTADLEQLRKFIAAQSGLGEELGDTLQHLNDASDSVKQLADFLERNPNALLTGKKRPQ